MDGHLVDTFGGFLLKNLPCWLAVFGLMLATLRDRLRPPQRRSAALALGAVVAVGLATAAIAVGFGIVENNVQMVLVLAVFYAVLCATVDTSRRKRLFVLFSGAAVVAFTVLVGDIAFALFASGLPRWLQACVDAAVSVGLPAALLPLFAGRMRWAVDEVDDGLWRGLWVVPVAFLASATALYMLRWAVTLDTPWSRFAYALAGVLLVALLVVAYLSLFATLQKSAENERLRAEAQVAAFQTSRYASLRDRMRESSQARHDFRHKLVVLDALAERGDVEGLRAALAEYGELAGGAPERGTLCANFAVDAVAAHFLGRARAAGAEVRCELAALPEQLPVAESDVCMVLANLLENAVEAVERLDAGGEAGAGAGGSGSGSGGAGAVPRIAVRAAVQGAALVLSVENTCVPGEDMPISAVSAADGLPSSKRPGPGVGLTSAASLAAKHRGELRAGRQGPTFTAQAVLRG